MITALKRTAIVSLLGICAFVSKAQLIITPNTVAQQLAQRLVGDGITISNATLTGSPLATAYFKNISGNGSNGNVLGFMFGGCVAYLVVGFIAILAIVLIWRGIADWPLNQN